MAPTDAPTFRSCQVFLFQAATSGVLGRAQRLGLTDGSGTMRTFHVLGTATTDGEFRQEWRLCR